MRKGAVLSTGAFSLLKEGARSLVFQLAPWGFTLAALGVVHTEALVTSRDSRCNLFALVGRRVVPRTVAVVALATREPAPTDAASNGSDPTAAFSNVLVTCSRQPLTGKKLETAIH